MKNLTIKAIGFHFDNDTMVLQVSIEDSQVELVRTQLGRPAVEQPLIEKATETLIGRLIGERIEAQLESKRHALAAQDFSARAWRFETALKKILEETADRKPEWHRVVDLARQALEST